MPCYNCTPIPRPGYHAVQAIIHKGVPYCVDCGGDVTHELDVEKICGAVPKQAVQADAEKPCSLDHREQVEDGHRICIECGGRLRTP